MATTQRSKKPGRLTRGFDSLTLNPSPRLRSLRMTLHSRDLTREVWTTTVRAVTEALNSATDVRLRDQGVAVQRHVPVQVLADE